VLIAGCRAIAHRGGGAEAPENSLSAFAHAVDLGYTELETDIRATSDGVAVVHHDATLDRTTDARGLIRTLPWSQVRRARIHGREPVLRLEEALEAFPDVRFTLDVKEAGSVPALIAALGRISATDRVVIGSFSHSRLTRVRQSLTVETSASPREVLALVAAARRSRRVRIPARYAHIPPSFARIPLAEPGFISTAHALGLEVHVWTIDDPDTMHHLLDLGVDGVMSDRPSLLRDVLRSRGVWSGDGNSSP
jgi:glycerophosphoryl diester phosphodiesterase